MIAQDFEESNITYNPPADLEESQCPKVPAFVGEIETGILEGVKIIVLCYKPTPEEAFWIEQGGEIYLTILGQNLPPHMISTSFFQATHPS